MAAKKKKVPVWESGATEAGRFAARLRQVAGKKNLDLDGIVRLSARFRHATVTRWWFGTRVPRPASIVDLARAMGVDPVAFIKPIKLDDKTAGEVAAIVASEPEEPADEMGELRKAALNMGQP